MKKICCILGILGIIGIGTAFLINSNTNNNCVAGRGCCSGHGGVCGCVDGRSKCCDGSLSPSCHCFKDDVKGLEI